jgi:hypothetical protein
MQIGLARVGVLGVLKEGWQSSCRVAMQLRLFVG